MYEWMNEWIIDWIEKIQNQVFTYELEYMMGF